MCDPLEPRRLLTALTSANDGHTSGDNSWYIQPYGAYLKVWSPIPADIDSPGSPTLGTFTSADITGGAGDDTVLLDARPGNFASTVHFGGGGDDDVLVENLKFDGGNQKVYGIASFSSSRVTLDNCDVSDIFLDPVTHCAAAFGQASTDNHFTNNYVHDGPGGIAFSGQWGGYSDTGTIIVGNTVRRHHYDVFNGYMTNALIAGNDIDGLHHLNPGDDTENDVVVGGGMTLAGTKTTGESAIEQYSEDCVVFDNTLINSNGGGFQCDAWIAGTIMSVTVFRNSFTYCDHEGLLIQSATDSYFIENDFSHNGTGAYVAGAFNVTISNNSFSCSIGNGIFVDSNDLWAQPHTPPFPEFYCILVTDGLNIIGNTISHVGGYGIDVGVHQAWGKSCTISNVTIPNNTISYSGLDGIRIEVRDNHDNGAAIGNIDIHDNSVTHIAAGFWLSINGFHWQTEIIHVWAGPEDQTELSNNPNGDDVFDNRSLLS